MDIASGNRKPTGQIEPHFEHSNDYLINSIGASCDGDEKRKRARDPAEDSYGVLQKSRLTTSPEPGPESGQVCCLHNALDLQEKQ